MLQFRLIFLLGILYAAALSGEGQWGPYDPAAEMGKAGHAVDTASGKAQAFAESWNIIHFADVQVSAGGRASSSKFYREVLMPALAEHIKKEKPLFAINSGDIALNGSSQKQDWKEVQYVYQPLVDRIPFWPTQGDHDLAGDGNPANYREAWKLPSNGPEGIPGLSERLYWFRFRNALFISLEYGQDHLDKRLAWLEGLLRNSKDDHIIITQHRPYWYGRGKDGKPTGSYQDKAYHDLFVRYKDKITAVICGHAHDYTRMRQDGVMYFVNGCASYSISRLPSPRRCMNADEYYTEPFRGFMQIEFRGPRAVFSEWQYADKDLKPVTRRLIDRWMVDKRSQLELPIKVAPLKGKAPLTVMASAAGCRSSAPGSLKVEWDWGGTPATFKSEKKGSGAKKTFRKPGTYNLIARVTDRLGHMETRSYTIEVRPESAGEVAEFAPLASGDIGPKARNRWNEKPGEGYRLRCSGTYGGALGTKEHLRSYFYVEPVKLPRGAKILKAVMCIDIMRVNQKGPMSIYRIAPGQLLGPKSTWADIAGIRLIDQDRKAGSPIKPLDTQMIEGACTLEMDVTDAVKAWLGAAPYNKAEEPAGFLLVIDKNPKPGTIGKDGMFEGEKAAFQADWQPIRLEVTYR